jgi:hypothetical protein
MWRKEIAILKQDRNFLPKPCALLSRLTLGPRGTPSPQFGLPDGELLAYLGKGAHDRLAKSFRIQNSQI